MTTGALRGRMTVEEAVQMQPGTLVEWWHPKAGWRPARFLELHDSHRSVKISTELGCEVHRRIDLVRLAPSK